MIRFTSPQYLWGLLALAGPVIIHLVNRSRPEQIFFPHIRFLYRSQLPRDGKRKLRDIFLLILRMLIITALIAAISGPKLVHSGSDEITPGAVFILDCSASMGSAGKLERGLALAEKAVCHHANWRFGAICSGNGICGMLEPATGTDRLLDFLRSAKPGYRNGSHGEALSAAAGMLQGMTESKIFIISDLQRGDWVAAGKTLPPNIKLEILDCGTDSNENAGIISVRTASLPQERRKVMVTLKNFGATPAERKLTCQTGEESFTRELTVPPFGRTAAVFVFDCKDKPESGRAFLNSDDYQLDDEYRFTMEDIPGPLAILLSGEDSSSRLADYFTGHALESWENSTGGDGFRVTDFDSLADEDFTAAECLVLLSLPQHSGSWELIKDFAYNGGTVLAAPASGKADTLLAKLTETGLMTVKSAGMAEAGPVTSLGVGWIDPDSVPGTLFKEGEDGDFFTFSIYRHLRLLPGGDVKVPVKSLDGLPLLLEKTTGKGKCYLFAFNFDPKWSNFPFTNSFLPLLRELCKGGKRGETSVERVPCGADRNFDTSRPGFYAVGDRFAEVFPPQEEAVPVFLSPGELENILFKDKADNTIVSAAVNTVDLRSWIAAVIMMLLPLEAVARGLGRKKTI